MTKGGRRGSRVLAALVGLVAAVLLVLAGGSVALAAEAPVIAWNPSHQNDNGSNGWHEYLVCEDIAQRAMALLPEFTNVLCWETGMGLTSHNYSALQSEIDTAAAANAQIFISVHVNGGGASGVFACYETGDYRSARYAETLLKWVSAQTGLRYRGLQTRSDLYVLDPTYNPAPVRVLLELGDNVADRALLSSEEGRQRLAAALADAVRGNTPPPVRYEQDDALLGYSGIWESSSTTSASGASFAYANAADGSVTATFEGTYLGWIAKKSPAYGQALVTVDDRDPVTVDLYSATTLWGQKVWDTGALDPGPHTVKIERTGLPTVVGGGLDINIDSFDVLGTLTQAPGSPAPQPSPIRFEQSDSRITYLGKWLTFLTTGASGGSYKYADSRGATAVVWFSGTRLDWLATTGTTQGMARVQVDGGATFDVNFYSPSTLRKQKVWSTGPLPMGTHKVTVTWLGQRGRAGGGTRVNLDALDVVGTLLRAPAVLNYQQNAAGAVYRGSWATVSTSSASGGSFRYTAVAGSSVTVTFSGTHFVWVAKKSPAYGMARLTLDGGTPVLVSLYSASTLWKQKAWISGPLSPGLHTLKIECTGLKRVSTGGRNINVDAFEVLGTIGRVR